MFSSCYWLPWPDGLCILWNYYSSHTAVSELPDVLTPANPRAQPRNGNAMALLPMAHLSHQEMGELHGIMPRDGGGARLRAPRGQAEPRPLKTPILGPFWYELWRLMSQEKLWRHEVLASITSKAPPDLPDSTHHWIMCCYVKNFP